MSEWKLSAADVIWTLTDLFANDVDLSKSDTNEVSVEDKGDN